jgi:hypothetical protein
VRGCTSGRSFRGMYAWNGWRRRVIRNIYLHQGSDLRLRLASPRGDLRLLLANGHLLACDLGFFLGRGGRSQPDWLDLPRGTDRQGALSRFETMPSGDP